MRQAIYDLLSADATLTGLLPGGLYDAAEVSHISRTTTEDAFLQGDLITCALLKMGDEEPQGPYIYGSRQELSVHFFDRFGYDKIELARERVYELLHDQKLTPADSATTGNWQILWVGDTLHQRDEALDAATEISRFECINLR